MPTIEEARHWYPASDPVHGFDHVLRVYHMAERLGLAEGADLQIVRAAVLLHDANPGNESAREGHHHSSAAFAEQVLAGEGWTEERIALVTHCIRSHRFRDDREPPTTLEAQVLFDADKLDAIGAIGVARAIAFAVDAGQPAYALPSEHFLQTGQTVAGEAHSAYHEYLFKLRHIRGRLYTPSARALADARHKSMVEFFERLAAEMQGQA